jgi:hypothetical protein
MAVPAHRGARQLIDQLEHRLDGLSQRELLTQESVRLASDPLDPLGVVEELGQRDVRLA